MLQPVRARVTAQLGQRPTILLPDIRDQPQHQRASVAQRLASREPPRDPIHHLIEATPPPINVYPVCRGGCGIITFDSSHKLRTMPQSPPLPAQTRRQPSIYGCSTSAVGGNRIGENPAGDQSHRRDPRQGGPSPRQPQYRCRGRGPKTAGAGLLRPPRSPRSRPAPLTARDMSTLTPVGAGRPAHDPRTRRSRSL